MLKKSDLKLGGIFPNFDNHILWISFLLLGTLRTSLLLLNTLTSVLYYFNFHSWDYQYLPNLITDSFLLIFLSVL